MFSLLKQEILHKDNRSKLLKLEVPSFIPTCFIYLLINIGHVIMQDIRMLSLVWKYWLLELHVTLQVFEVVRCSRLSLWDSTAWLLSEIQTTLSMLSNLFWILWPCSQPSATIAVRLPHRQFTPNSTFPHLRFFGSSNWNKMWICSVLAVFNVILSAWALTRLRQCNSGYVGHRKRWLLVHVVSVLKYALAYSLYTLGQIHAVTYNPLHWWHSCQRPGIPLTKSVQHVT